MPEPEAPAAVIILLSCCAGLLMVVLLLIFRISGRLSRIEHQLTQNKSRPDTVEQAPTIAETSPGGAFEEFLREDPARRDLTKGEQFAAYRQWRDEKGLNWSNS
jgi:hypothetical protein